MLLGRSSARHARQQLQLQRARALALAAARPARCPTAAAPPRALAARVRPPLRRAAAAPFDSGTETPSRSMQQAGGGVLQESSEEEDDGYEDNTALHTHVAPLTHLEHPLGGATPSDAPSNDWVAPVERRAPPPLAPPPAAVPPPAADAAAAARAPARSVRWSKVKRRLRPTQAALGWDWTFYKLQNFTSAAEAQRYMNGKPVPYVQRGSKKYIVDHHHTLCALELSGHDPEIILEQVRSFDKSEQSLDAFWGYMEGKGWSFLRDEQYNRLDPSLLPRTFDLRAFRNDVYRSLGGFLRVYDVLKRGKTLEDTLFFEFRWGFFVWTHRNNEFGLWPDAVLHRMFVRTVALVRDIDTQEYKGRFDEGATPPTVAELVYLCREVIEPAYQMLSFYVRYLCVAYDDQPRARKEALVPGLREIFGIDSGILPGKVLRASQ